MIRGHFRLVSGKRCQPHYECRLMLKISPGTGKKTKKKMPTFYFYFLNLWNGLETLFRSSEPSCLFTCFTFENGPILWKPWHFHLCTSVKLQSAYLHVLYCLVCNWCILYACVACKSCTFSSFKKKKKIQASGIVSFFTEHELTMPVCLCSKCAKCLNMSLIYMHA